MSFVVSIHLDAISQQINMQFSSLPSCSRENLRQAKRVFRFGRVLVLIN
jgi:hypothetical protein